jgi:eukaryotic-like serine/threonine-protein kinase
MGLDVSVGARIYIGALSMEGDHNLRPLLQEKYSDGEPKISPDGRWMAYASDESGKAEVYVRSFPDVNQGKWQVSTGGGEDPLWSRDGRELFYKSGDTAMVVAVDTEPTLKPEKPRVLFRGTYSGMDIGTSTSSAPINLTYWDIHPDGKRFLMMKPATPQKSTSS